MSDADSATVAASTTTIGSPLHLDVLKYLKRQQQRNGLKDGQYIRYHHYCTRRLHRIRTLLKLLQATNKPKSYKRRDVAAKECATVDHLTLPLVQAERAWAYALEMQAEQSAEDNYKNTRRLHIVRRLAKAAAHARAALALAQSTASAATQLQTQAYADWLSGCHKLETEDWAAAAALFTRADAVLKQVAAVADLDLKALCVERSQQIAMLLSLCGAQLRSADPEAAAALMELLSADTGAGDEQLQARLRAMVEQTLKSDGAQLQEVVWRGHTAPVQSEKLRVLLLEAKKLRVRLDDRLKRVDDSRGSENVDADTANANAGNASAVASAPGNSENALYNKLASVYDDAGAVVRAALKELQQAKVKTEAVVAEARALQVLKNYIDVHRLSATLERNIGTALALTRKFEKGAVAARAAAAAGNVVRLTLKPSALVTVYDRLLQNIADIESEASGVDAAVGSSSASATTATTESDNGERLASLPARKLAFSAVRVYFLALSYAAAHRPSEALALFGRCQLRCQQASAALRAAGAAAAGGSVLVSDLDLVTGVEAACEAAGVKARVGVLQRELARTAALREGLAGVALANGSASSSSGSSSAGGANAGAAAHTAPLMDRLEAFDAGAVGRQFDLVAIPPVLVPAASKPFLFDIAGNGFAYLDTSASGSGEAPQAAASGNKAEEAQGGSFWSRIWG